jgi:hypothetical protein
VEGYPHKIPALSSEKPLFRLCISKRKDKHYTERNTQKAPTEKQGAKPALSGVCFYGKELSTAQNKGHKSKARLSKEKPKF